MSEDRKVWIGCLACYNDGDLVGNWVDPGGGSGWKCPDHAGHEEFEVFDHEGFGATRETSPQYFAKLDQVLGEVESCGYPADAFLAWLDGTGYDPDDDLELFQDSFQGTFESESAFAQDLAESIGAIPNDLPWPLSCIDWDAAASELFMSDYWAETATDGGIWVFCNV